MRRIVVLGASGMIGHKMFRGLSEYYPATYGLLHGSSAEVARFGFFSASKVVDRVDARNFDEVSRRLDELKADVVLNCIGITYRRPEAADVAICTALNTDLPQKLASWAASRGRRVIHFSTDCVFDGAEGGYTEQSPPNSQDLYGRTKGLGEITGKGCLTLRTSMIGRELTGKSELLEWFLAQEGQSIRGFRRALYTGITTNLMVRVVADLIERHPGLSGLYQVTSDMISKYDLLCLIRDRFGMKVAIEADDTVSKKRNLVGKRFREVTGFVCPTWPELVDELVRERTLYERWS